MKFVCLLFTLFLIGCDGDILNRLRYLQSEVERHPENKTTLNEIASYANHSSFVTRTNAVTILGQIASNHPELSKDIAPVVLKSLNDSDRAVKVAAVQILLDLPPAFSKPAIPKLRGNLSQGNNDLSWASAEALGHLGPDAKDAVPDLTNILSNVEPIVKDGPPQLRAYAAEALGNIGSPAVDTLPKLESLLQDKDPELRKAVGEAIQKLRAIPETN